MAVLQELNRQHLAGGQRDFSFLDQMPASLLRERESDLVAFRNLADFPLTKLASGDPLAGVASVRDADTFRVWIVFGDGEVTSWSETVPASDSRPLDPFGSWATDERLSKLRLRRD